MKKQLLVTTLAAAMAATFAPATQAAEISASAGVSNFYLWRGLNLSAAQDASGLVGGAPAVWGDINVAEGPVYAGMWTSSGDEAYGTEYDLYVGAGHSIDDFSFDISYWTYVYPGLDAGAGEVADVIGSIGYGPVSFSAYHSVGDNDGADNAFTYFTLAGGYEDFSALVGYHTEDGAVAEYWHLDLGYSYNDSLGFTLVLPLSQEEAGNGYNDPMFNVSYSLPIDL